MYSDNLTEIPNRFALLEYLKDIEQANVFLLNVDNFNNINSTYDFDIGDKVLIEITMLINIVKPATCKLFRMNSDEFVLVDERSMETKELASVANSILSFFDNTEIIIDDDIEITIWEYLKNFPADASAENGRHQEINRYFDGAVVVDSAHIDHALLQFLFIYDLLMVDSPYEKSLSNLYEGLLEVLCNRRNYYIGSFGEIFIGYKRQGSKKNNLQIVKNLLHLLYIFYIIYVYT